MDPDELVGDRAPQNEGDDDDSEEENPALLPEELVEPELAVPEKTEPQINLLYILDRELHGAPGDFATATAHSDDKITALLRGPDHLTRIQRIHEIQDDRVTAFYNNAVEVIERFSNNQMNKERNKLATFLKLCPESSGLGNEAIDVAEGKKLDPLLAELVESWKPTAFRAIHGVHEPLLWLLGGALEWGAQGCLIATCKTSTFGSVLETLKKNWIVGRNYHDTLWNFVIGSIMKSIETDDQHTKEEVEKVVKLLRSISEIYVLVRVQDLLTGHTNDKCCVMFAFGWELHGKIEMVKNGDAYAKIEAASQTIKPDMLKLFSHAEDELPVRVPPDQGSDSDEDINQQNVEQADGQIEAEHGFPLAETDDRADRLSEEPHQIPSIAYIITALGISEQYAVPTDIADMKIKNFLEQDSEHQSTDQDIRDKRDHDDDDDDDASETRVIRFYEAALTAIRTFTIRSLKAKCKKLAHFLTMCSEASKDQRLGTESIDTEEGEDLDPKLEKLVKSWKWAVHDILNIHEVHKPLFWLLGGAFKKCVDGCLIATSGTSNIGPVLETLKRNWTVGENYHNSLWNFIIGAIMENIKTDNRQTDEDIGKLVKLLASHSEIHVLGRVQNLLTSNTEDEFRVMFAFGWELRGNIEIVENKYVYAKLEEGNWTIRPDLSELFHPTKGEQLISGKKMEKSSSRSGREKKLSKLKMATATSSEVSQLDEVTEDIRYRIRLMMNFSEDSIKGSALRGVDFLSDAQERILELKATKETKKLLPAIRSFEVLVLLELSNSFMTCYLLDWESYNKCKKSRVLNGCEQHVKEGLERTLEAKRIIDEYGMFMLKDRMLLHLGLWSSYRGDSFELRENTEQGIKPKKNYASLFEESKTNYIEAECHMYAAEKVLMDTNREYSRQSARVKIEHAKVIMSHANLFGKLINVKIYLKEKDLREPQSRLTQLLIKSVGKAKEAQRILINFGDTALKEKLKVKIVLAQVYQRLVSEQLNMIDRPTLQRYANSALTHCNWVYNTLIKCCQVNYELLEESLINECRPEETHLCLLVNQRYPEEQIEKVKLGYKYFLDQAKQLKKSALASHDIEEDDDDGSSRSSDGKSPSEPPSLLTDTEFDYECTINVVQS